MPIVYIQVLSGERREATTLEQYVWFQQNKSMWSLQPMPGTEPPPAANKGTLSTTQAAQASTAKATPAKK